jgi:hypothetical protein
VKVSLENAPAQEDESKDAPADPADIEVHVSSPKRSVEQLEISTQIEPAQ